MTTEFSGPRDHQRDLDPPKTAGHVGARRETVAPAAGVVRGVESGENRADLITNATASPVSRCSVTPSGHSGTTDGTTASPEYLRGWNDCLAWMEASRAMAWQVAPTKPVSVLRADAERDASPHRFDVRQKPRTTEASPL